MEKEFKTIKQQIDILKSKNLIIKNYNKTYKILEKNNYYYVVNGYKELFLDTTTSQEKFIDNTTFEELYTLYRFDKNIKIFFLKYILLIENEIDTYISYEFSKEYGHKDYLLLQNFNNSIKNPLIKKFLNDINLEIEYQYKNDNKMIVHYINNYQYVPLWVLVRILSFGKISKFYSFMKHKEQNSISKKYALRIKEFKVILHNLTLIRNICAHDEKLYDIKLKSRISSTIYHKKLNIIETNGNYQFATRDLFSIVIILKLLLCDKNFNEFYKHIIREIKVLKGNIKTINIEKVLNKMGFPKNYEEILKL